MGLYDRLPSEYQPWLANRMQGHSFLSLEDVERQMGVESGGNPRAYNASGASGLFQQLPGTFKSRNVGGDIYDPYQNTEAYLSYMDEGFKKEGSKEGAYGYYFAGPDHKQWGPKTQQYIRDNTGSGIGPTGPTDLMRIAKEAKPLQMEEQTAEKAYAQAQKQETGNTSNQQFKQFNALMAGINQRNQAIMNQKIDINRMANFR